jgi:hypothetical protein
MLPTDGLPYLSLDNCVSEFAESGHFPNGRDHIEIACNQSGDWVSWQPEEQL